MTTLLFEKDTFKHDGVITALLIYESRWQSCSDVLSGEDSALVSTHGQSQSIEREEGSNWHRWLFKFRLCKSLVCWDVRTRVI